MKLRGDTEEVGLLLSNLSSLAKMMQFNLENWDKESARVQFGHNWQEVGYTVAKLREEIDGP